MSSRLTKYEQEVVIQFSADDKVATVYSANPVYIRKLERLSLEFPNDYRLVKKDEVSVTCEVNRKLIAFRKPVPPREYTDEERRIMAERFAKALGRD